jgi:membrane dipeptidase
MRDLGRADLTTLACGSLRAPRRLLRGTALLLCAGCAGMPGGGADDLDAKARRLHAQSIVIDTHSDTTPRFEEADWSFTERHQRGHMDLPRIREGGLDVQFWSIYMGKREGKGEAIREAIGRIDAVHELVRRHPDEIALAGSVADIRRGVAQGKLVSLMGVEGGHIIENQLSALRTYYQLGVRYMTLTHSFNTDWADSAGTREPVAPQHDGLTDFGRDVVREMNRLGMLVDISHVSDATFYDALEVTRAPVIASHSSCRALADSPRNLSDDMLRKLAQNGGVIMINFYSGYVDMEAAKAGDAHREALRPELEALAAKYPDGSPELRRARGELIASRPYPQTSLAKLLDHFDHALKVAGPDHVGIGADWDGVSSLPKGMDDITRLPALTRGLLERGHSEETVRKVLGENLLRVMGDAERVARAWKSEPSSAAE